MNLRTSIQTFIVALASFTLFSGTPAYAEGDQMCRLSVQAAAFTNETLLSISAHGEFFKNPIALEKGPIDRSSPKNLARALFKAMNEQDTNLYAAVMDVDVSEVAYLPNPKNKAIAMNVIAELNYGELVILLIDLQLPAHSWIQPYYFQRVEGKYRISARPDDNALELMEAYFGPGWDKQINLSGDKDIATVQSEFTVTNAPPSGGRPLIFTFPGQQFTPPLQIEKSSPPSETNAHTSPTMLFSWAVVHAGQGNKDGYMNLLYSPELQTSYRSGSFQSYLAEEFPITTKMTSKTFRLSHTIYFNDVALLFYETEGGHKSWMGARKSGDQWFISDVMKADKRNRTLLHPILRHFDVPLTLFPNLLPSREK